jgi:hypothetical protein
MGKNCSKVAYPVIDTIFVDLGCIGLLRYEYSERNRMTNAPFYTVKIRAKNYADMLNQIIDAIKASNDPPPQAASDAPTAPTPRMGPVYMAAARDFEKNYIECFLFWPNVNKTTRNKYSNNYERGVSNRWMRRLFMTDMYKLKNAPPICSYRDIFDESVSMYAPQLPMSPPATRRRAATLIQCNPQTYVTTNPLNKPGDPISFMYGCRTDKSARCVASSSDHKRMGIYSDKKKAFHYPSVYFHVYKINPNDPRVAEYIAKDSPVDPVRNLLPAGLDLFVGCKSMLVSDNKEYCFAVGNKRLGIYKNMTREECGKTLIPRFERKFKGMDKTRLRIEDNMIAVYSSDGAKGNEVVVYYLQIAQEEAQYPLTLMLENTGALVVYDRADKRSVVIDENGALDPSLQNLDYINQNLQGRAMDGFDLIEEKRDRLSNFNAYLKLINAYVVDVSGIDLAASNIPLPQLVLQVMPPYDEKEDYIRRWNLWLDYLIAHFNLDIAAIKAYYLDTVTKNAETTQATSATSAATTRGLTEAGTIDDLGIEDLSFANEPEETPEEREKRIDAEEKERQETNKKNEETKQLTSQTLTEGVDLTETPMPDITDFVPSTPLSAENRAALADDMQSALKDVVPSFDFDFKSVIPSVTQSIPSGGFDTVVERSERYNNLFNYLRAIQVFVEEFTGIPFYAYDIPLPEAFVSQIPQFDESYDYNQRWNEFLTNLQQSNKIDSATFQAYFVTNMVQRSPRTETQ